MLGKCCTIAGWELKYLPLWYISENCSSNQLHSDLRTQLKSKNKRTCTCWCIVSWYLILSDFHYFLNKYRIYKDFSLDLYWWVSSLVIGDSHGVFSKQSLNQWHLFGEYQSCFWLHWRRFWNQSVHPWSFLLFV